MADRAPERVGPIGIEMAGNTGVGKIGAIASDAPFVVWPVVFGLDTAGSRVDES